MIYILFGEDIKNKSIYIKELTQKRESFFVSGRTFDKESIMNYTTGQSLFGGAFAVIIDDLFKEEEISFSPVELSLLKESETVFIFKEDKLSVVEQKKYKKYGEVRNFELKKIPPSQKFNIFNLTDAFAKRDKIAAWTLYCKAISSGVEPEAIAGVLFWKIKTMILGGTRLFSKEELKLCSSGIVSLYHKAHRGECDFSTSLEQFILLSLSSK